MITPGSPEWLALVTASKVPCILGLSRFKSQYTLWHEMAGLIEPDPVTEKTQAMFDAGHAFEHALAELYRIEHPAWRLSPGEVQVRRDDLGFPAVATIDRRASRGRSRRVVEFKTARSLDEWGDDFTDDAPLDYLVQVMWQMLVTGYTQQPAHLMVMGPFFRWHTYEIGFDQGLADTIRERCAAWVESLEAGDPPALDSSVSTYECVRKLHPDIEPDTTVQLDAALAGEYLVAEAAAKTAEVRARAAKTAVLAAMGNAESALVGDTWVAKRMPHHSGAVSLRRNPKAAADLEPKAVIA